MFGQQQNTSPFSSTPTTSTFGAGSAFGTPTPAPFGSTTATGGFGTAAPTTGGFGSTAPASTGIFGQAPSAGGLFGSSQPAAASTGSIFGSARAPAPGAFGTFGSTATQTPAFGSPPAFGQTTQQQAPQFGSAGPTFTRTSAQPSTGGFGSTGFGSTTSTFNQPAGGSIFGQTQTSVFGQPATAPGTGFFGSTPAPAPLFGSPAPAPGGMFQQPVGVGVGSGTRAAPFQPTQKEDGTSSIIFQCLTAMPQYEATRKSFEELRAEDYAQGNRGDGSQGQQSPVGGFGGAFGATPAPAPIGFGTFGSTAQPTTTTTGFQTNAPATLPFGAASAAPAFGAAPAPSAFGAAPAAPTFGAAPTPSAFGGFGAKPATTGLFGAPAPAPVTTGGLFGQPAPSPGGYIFGSAPAAPAPAGGLFGQPAPAPGSSIFGSAPAPAPSGGLFGQLAPAPAFGAAPAGGSLFGSQPASAPAPGLFGSAPAPSAFSFGGAPQPAPAAGSLFGARPPGTGLFGSPAPAPGGLFQAPAPQPASGLFGAPTAPVPAAPAFMSPPAMIVQPAADVILHQQLAAIDNQRKELEQMDVWRGRSPQSSYVIPASQSESQALHVSPYSASPMSIMPYQASPMSAAKIRPRGFTSSTPKPVSILKSPMPVMSPDSHIASSTKRLVIKSTTPKPTMRLRIKDVAVEEAKEDRPLRLPSVLTIRQTVTSPPVGASPMASPPFVETPLAETTPAEETKTPEMTPTNGKGYDFYQKVIAGASTSCSSRKASPGESESLVPKLTKPDYALAPSLNELASMSEADLATVSGFTVTRPGFGSVSWDGSVDVRGVNLDEVITINDRDVAVYDLEETTGTKPPVGTKLNRPAVITMYNVLPKEGADAEAIEKFERKVAKSTKGMNAELISYDSSSGMWKFRVPHFSRYGLFDDTDDENDDDMDMANVEAKATSQHFESGKRGGRSPGIASPGSPEGLGIMDVDEHWLSAFVSEDETDVPFVGDFEMDRREKVVMREAELAYNMMSRTLAKERSRKDEPKSILRKQQREKEAKMLFPDEGVVLVADGHVDCRPVPPSADDLTMSSRPGVCARIAQRCGIESFSASTTDYGMRMGRTFRVGWMPDGSFLRLQPGSATVIQQSRPLFTYDKDDSAERLLATHLKNAKRIASPSRECPSFALGGNLSKTLADYVATSAQEEPKDSSDPEQGLVLMRAFSLLLCLFTEYTDDRRLGNDVSMLANSEGRKALSALKEQGRIDACVNWLVGACAEDVRTDVKQALQKDRPIFAIFSALAGGDIEQASSIATKAGHFHLASMIASGSAGFDSIREQVDQWQKSGATRLLPTQLLRIYTLLGGDLDLERGLHLASVKAGEPALLDWRRRLCMLLTFGTHPHEESTLESLLETYESNVADDVSPYPVPRYRPNGPTDGPQCLLFRILDFVKSIGGREGSAQSSVSLASVVAPSGYTPSMHDFSGAFHVSATISALGCGPRLSPLEQARLLDGYASQLLSAGRWDLAAYLMLCSFGSENSEELVSRERVTKALILQFCSDMSGPEMLARRTYLEEKIGLPCSWFDEALAYRCAHRGDSYQYVKHLSGFSLDQAREAVEDLVVPNMLFMSVEDVRKSIDLLEAFSWDEASLAATTLDFFELSAGILKLSECDSPADETEELMSFTEISLSVEKRLQAHVASADSVEKTSCGLNVVPGYRLVPLSAFLAEALAGVTFLQLQLKALAAGSSIWGGDFFATDSLKRPFKVASELAFIAVREAGAHEKAFAPTSEAVRGFI